MNLKIGDKVEVEVWRMVGIHSVFDSEVLAVSGPSILVDTKRWPNLDNPKLETWWVSVSMKEMLRCGLDRATCTGYIIRKR